MMQLEQLYYLVGRLESLRTKENLKIKDLSSIMDILNKELYYQKTIETDSELKVNDIVKYKLGQKYYILELINYSEDVARLKHKNGNVYLINSIKRLVKVKDVEYADFISITDPEEFAKKIYNVEYYSDDLPGELWKKVEYLKDYSVSNKGRVKSQRGIREQILQYHQNENGYNFVRIAEIINDIERRRGFNVAILVAINFIDNPNACNFVKFKDNNPDNIIVENIEWVASGKVQQSPLFNNPTIPKVEKHSANGAEFTKSDKPVICYLCGKPIEKLESEIFRDTELPCHYDCLPF